VALWVFPPTQRDAPTPEKGYEAVTIRAIAERADIGYATLRLIYRPTSAAAFGR
jgi:hypothetical protein